MVRIIGILFAIKGTRLLTSTVMLSMLTLISGCEDQAYI